MHNVMIAPISGILAGFRRRFAFQVEIVALRHQLNVRCSVPSRPKLHASDRFLWVLFSRLWPDWRSALILIKPEKVIACHLKGLRLFWTLKSKHGRSGRPGISTEIRDLIRTMSKANVIGEQRESTERCSSSESTSRRRPLRSTWYSRASRHRSRGGCFWRTMSGRSCR